MGICATNESTALLDAIRERAEFLGQDPVATAFNVGNSFYLVNEAWRRSVDEGADFEGRHHFRSPVTSAEIIRHYRACVHGVDQQVFATYGIPGEILLRKRMVSAIKPGSTVLDFGAGIGSQLLPLLVTGCDCTHVDVGGVQRHYAEWRYKKRGYDVEIIDLDIDYMHTGVPRLRGRVFDVVICTEVIEHVPDPEPFVAQLVKYVRSGGLLIATTSFDDGDGMVPMHLNIGKYVDEDFEQRIIPGHGFARIGLDMYLKEYPSVE